jgi:hypothetical protein
MREVLALLIPACAIGILVLPCPFRPGRRLVAAVTLAFCLGIGVSSLTSTALIIVLGISPATRGFVLADIAIWTSVGVLGWWLRRANRRGHGRLPKAESPKPKAEGLEPKAESLTPADWLLRAAFGIAAMAALASVVMITRASPHGEWDAWAIWNQHARFLFRGGGSEAWRALLAVEWSHPDYPLLLPASVARVWAYAGHESILGPALISTTLGMASVALVVTALGGRRAWAAGTLMLGAHLFLTQAAAQCADVPLACFIVATLAVAFGGVLRTSNPESRIPNPESRVSNPESRVPAVIAGATAAMAAWTKNEGLVFALLMLLVALIIAVHRRDGRQLLWAIAGATPVVIAIVWFKLALAPPSVLTEGLSLTVFTTRLFDVHRHLTVMTLMAEYMVRWSTRFGVAIFPLVGLAAVWMAFRSERVRAMAAVVGLMLLSYYFVYVLTPFDIPWHISTSFDRLLVQLWPSLVLTVFLGLQSSVSGPQSSVSSPRSRG